MDNETSDSNLAAIISTKSAFFVFDTPVMPSSFAWDFNCLTVFARSPSVTADKSNVGCFAAASSTARLVKRTRSSSSSSNCTFLKIGVVAAVDGTDVGGAALVGVGAAFVMSAVSSTTVRRIG